ncbi:hypothetical protein BDF22DRAFT_696383 [Syncephalis plumigaleata]|nr:hypothetical protein BDF22DRAFT_696383 [Syncephalis plumigaleata]
MSRVNRRYLDDDGNDNDAITLEMSETTRDGGVAVTAALPMPTLDEVNGAPSSSSVTAAAEQANTTRYPAHSTVKRSRTQSGRSFDLFPMETQMDYDNMSPGPPLDLPTHEGGYMDILDLTERNRTAASIHNIWKRQFYLLMEDPSSSGAAFFVSVFVVCMIVVSAVIATIETIPKFRSGETPIWFAIETAVVALLAIEAALRIYAHSDTAQRLVNFMLSPMTIIDTLVVLLYIIAYALGSDTTYVFRLSILRLFRLFRVFRVYQHSSLIQLSIEVMIVAIKRSTDALSALFFFMAMTVVIFSSLLYFAECGVWDEERHMFVTSDGLPSQFDSIPAVCWFVMVTITTTGYGDMVPQTFIGKLIAFPAMMMGILVINRSPLHYCGRNFTIVWETMKERQLHNPGHHVSIKDLETDNYQSETRRRISGSVRGSRHSSHLNDAVSENSEEINQLRTQVTELTALCQQNQEMLQQLMKLLHK